MKNTEEVTSFILGLLFGLVSGGIAALLLAPQPGEETRETITEQGIVLKNRAGNIVGQARELSKDVVNQSRLRFNDALEQGKQAAAKSKDDLSIRYAKAKKGE